MNPAGLFQPTVYLGWLSLAVIFFITNQGYVHAIPSLRASSPFGGYREKCTRERHARGTREEPSQATLYQTAFCTTTESYSVWYKQQRTGLEQVVHAPRTSCRSGGTQYLLPFYWFPVLTPTYSLPGWVRIGNREIKIRVNAKRQT